MQIRGHRLLNLSHRILKSAAALVRSHIPPLVKDRILGPEFDKLTDSFTAQVSSS
jgi:hypothetical protein